MTTLRTAAKHSNRLHCLYKCSARIAANARKSGYRALHIADEALINPTEFALDTLAYRQLRRKLGHANNNGLRIECTRQLPLADMAAVDTAWINHHGRARGATMGRFTPDYVAHQRVYLAWQGDVLTGFITFHVNNNKSALI